ncbi:MAG: hypothetical protein V8T53_00015 [Eubacteriales bacterium]
MTKSRHSKAICLSMRAGVIFIPEVQEGFISDKMTDSDCYFLTLAAVARELNIRKLTSARVHLAAGLPLTWVRRTEGQLQSIIFSKRKIRISLSRALTIMWNLSVRIFSRRAFPLWQIACVDSRVVDLVCDIGNGTMNVMYINECRPLAKKCFTEKYGTNQCMLAVHENPMKQFGVSVDETVLERVIRHGTAGISERYLTAMSETATEYAERHLPQTA